ncbi:hypothetical protein OUZ56_014929 [Daphnia magna]|uniref:Uncharacterized protein n=1 Tax=Daphnia magna TaxID=35525 RepID=A0ABR0ALA7_9CRUS|nr:hypothetical protein OUZ56_014929 [Daphnia magna]
MMAMQFWEVLINDVTTNPLGKPQVNRKVGVGPENRNNKFFLCSFEAQHLYLEKNKNKRSWKANRHEGLYYVWKS